MNILHFTQTYTPLGGTEQYIISITNLLGHSHKNRIVYFQDHQATIKDGEIPSYYINPGSYNGKAENRIRQLIENEGIDLAMVHTVKESMLVKEISELIPTIGYIHNFPTICPAETKFYGRGDLVCTRPFGLGCVPMIYLRRCCEVKNPVSVKRIMSVTQELKTTYQSLRSIIVASTYMSDLLIQNGFRADNIHILPPHFEYRQTIETSQKNPRILLFVGRLEIEKGFPYILKGLLEVKGICQLLVVGDGTLRTRYERLVDRLGLRSKVTFLGWLNQPELHQLYKRATLVVLPSIFPEPFGKVGIEAMSHARPVIAFDVGGISDWLKNGYNGYLVAPRDANQMATYIDDLLNNEDKAVEMGLNGYHYVNENFTPELHLSKLERIFNQAVQTNNQQITI